MTSNVYRPGDCVYFDTQQSSPYSIRRIEELTKSSNGNVEARTLCFFRRRDISTSLISLADKHNIALEEEQELEAESLNDKQKHQLKHRELFFSRQVETLPATHIRGKCNVTLLNETESLSSYLEKDDSFFYTLVYEPNQKTLLADRGEIRVGQRYQAEVPLKKPEPSPEIDLNKKYETLVFEPNHLTDTEIDQYLTIVKSIGTFGRALDISSSVKQPNLLLTAACASRDVTIQKALDILHENNYDISKALLSLTPNNIPMICKDELEEWSPAEAVLFEESLDKYSKGFFEIRKEVMPWKKMKNIVEYYYMWKTTDRYVQQKKLKATENENKLKQIYIPNTKDNKQMNNGVGAFSGETPGKCCESCGKNQSTLWYSYGQAHTNSRLCQSCWTYFKKFGGLRYPDRTNGVQEQPDKQTNTTATDNGLNVSGQANSNNTSNNASSPSIVKDSNNLNNNSDSTNTDEVEYKCKECDKTFNRQERLTAHLVTHRSIAYRCNHLNCDKEFKVKIHLVKHLQQSHSNGRSDDGRQIMKTKASFFLTSSSTIKVSRIFLKDLIRLKALAKNPFTQINHSLIKQEFQNKFSNIENLPKLPKLKQVNRGNVVDVALKLANKIDHSFYSTNQSLEWLKLPKINNKLSQSKFVSTNDFNNKITRKRTHQHSDLGNHSQTLNRRALDAPIKNKSIEQLVSRKNVNDTSITLNGKKARISISKIDGKNDICLEDRIDGLFLFRSTDATKKLRLQVQASLIKRSRRKPCNLMVIFPSNYDHSKL